MYRIAPLRSAVDANSRFKSPEQPDRCLRELVSRAIETVHASGFIRRLMSQKFGGYVLAFHDLPADAYMAIIDALLPERPVSLCELLERQRTGRSTSGLFAITVDDGVGETVRTLAAASIKRQWPISFFLPTGYLEQTHDMLFMHWQKVFPRLAGAVVPLRSGTVDLRRRSDYEHFIRSMREQRHTRPHAEHGPLIMECIGYAVNSGRATQADLAPPPPVSWSDVATLSCTELVTFESHGVSHSPVVALGEDELARELVHSRESIAAHTGRVPRCFAYPFGHRGAIGEAARAIVARHYEWGLTLLRGRLLNVSCDWVPRIAMYAEDLNNMVVRLKVLTAK